MNWKNHFNTLYKQFVLQESREKSLEFMLLTSNTVMDLKTSGVSHSIQRVGNEISRKF